MPLYKTITVVMDIKNKATVIQLKEKNVLYAANINIRAETHPNFTKDISKLKSFFEMIVVSKKYRQYEQPVEIAAPLIPRTGIRK